MLAVAAASPNPVVRKQVHTVLQLAATDHSHHPFETPRLRDLATVPGDGRGELDLGTVLGSSVRARYTINENVLTRHVLVTGETGAGKTTFFYNLLTDLTVPTWVFDRKSDYRHLLRNNADLIVLPWTQIRINPLRPPPGTRPRTWAQSFHEVFGDAYDLLGPSQHYLLPHLIELYEDIGISVDEHITADENRFPTIMELIQYLDEHGQKGMSQSGYKDRIHSRLRSLPAATGDLFDCRVGHSLISLLEQDVVFEVGELGSAHQDFLMEFLLTWVYRYRAGQQERGDTLRHVFLADEGKRLFSVFKERSDAKGVPQIDEVTTQLREFGEALIVGDQEPDKLTASLVANTHTKILFPVRDADQYDRIARSMDLSRRQRKHGRKMEIGQAVVQVGSGDAMAVQFQDYPLRKDVSDEEVRDRMQETWTQLAYSPVDNDIIGSTEQASSEPLQSGLDENRSEPDLSGNEEELLRDIVENPFNTHLERYNLFSESSPSQGITAKNNLLDAGLIQEYSTVDESGERKLLELTTEGKNHLQSQGVEVSYRGRGGVVHRYWQHRICELFRENGYDAEIEGDDADVAVSVDGGRIAIEVAMRDRTRELRHVRDRLDSGFDTVVIACRNPNIRSKLEERISHADVPDDRVTFRLFSDFFSFEDLRS